MRHNLVTLFALALLSVLPVGRRARATEPVRGDTPHSLIADGGFESPDARLARTEKVNAWGLFLHGNSDARITLADREGRGGSRCARYARTAAGSDNAHLDQIIAVESNATYEVDAWLRADGRLNPVLAVMTLNWRPLEAVASNAGTNWTRVTFIFNSADHDRVRFEWFPGAQGKPYQGFAGTSWLDDVRVTKLARVPPALQRALALVRAPRHDEIDPATVRTGAVGQPAPLRPISCRNGALVYDDGSEVALWGVNLQTALNWEYESRMRPCGIPLEADALKRIADRNLDELVRMHAGVIRMHLLPSDFSDGEGHLRDSVFLDVLDYTLAGCRARGLYVYLTLMNTMGSFYFKDSFMTGRDRRDWIVDPALADKSARYIRALLERENRYTKVPYKTEPALAAFEISNEPGYVDYMALTSEPQFAPLRRTFTQWCAAQGCTGSLDLQYRAFRHDQVRAYIDRMCAVIRATGTPKPIAWNLNWPQMVEGHEDVFQAVAESAVDAVSFCLYPGQADVEEHYWQHPVDLSGRNYLPYLDKSYAEYEQLRWALGTRFAGKAKVVYEYETFFNQSAYLYPAMARLFRALGVQIAQMWTYSLTPTAEYLSGSHHLNLYCTPQKAVSFTIAGELFARTPRYTRFDAPGADNRVYGPCAVSFTNNVSILQTADTYMQSRATAWSPFPPNPQVRRIVACGSSPQVTYDGTGAYFVEAGDSSVEIEINPDSTFVLPPWDSHRKGLHEKVCRLDYATPHRFVLHLPGWQDHVRVSRLEEGRTSPVATPGDKPAFEALPGRYRVERIH
jgi:hypothetical protein